MMDTIPQRQGHATDGELMRLLDGEKPSGDSPIDGHVTQCAECAARLARYRHRSAALADLLRATAPKPVDTARIRPPLDDISGARLRRQRRKPVWSHAGLRAAATIVVVAGVAAAAPPVREWLREQVQRWVGPAPATPVDSSPAAAPIERRTVAGPVVRFDVPSSELVVQLDSAQLAGTIEITSGNASRAEAQITTDLRDEWLIVLPGELRIRNTGASRASYRLTVPASVRQVRLRTSGGSDRDTTVHVRVGAVHLLRLNGR
jgi:hypothetical protein